MLSSYYTPRLSLGLITEADHAFVLELVNSEGWLRNIGDRHVHNEADAKAYIQKIQAKPDFYYWVVRFRKSGEPIGIVSFLKRTYLENFDIGFALLPQFQGQGFAQEAAEVVLQSVYSNPSLRPILATTVPSNLPSIRLLEKMGFRFDREIEEGLQKLHVYSKP